MNQANFSTKDYYEILQIPFGAPHSLIKRQYRKLALLLHPDHIAHNASNAEGTQSGKFMFELVHEAWQVLRDDRSRAIYDAQYRDLKQRNLLASSMGYVSDVVQLSQLAMDQTSDVFYIECRCSGRYELGAHLVEQAVCMSTDVDQQEKQQQEEEEEEEEEGEEGGLHGDHDDSIHWFIVQCTGCSLKIKIENDLV